MKYLYGINPPRLREGEIFFTSIFVFKVDLSSAFRPPLQPIVGVNHYDYTGVKSDVTSKVNLDELFTDDFRKQTEISFDTDILTESGHRTTLLFISETEALIQKLYLLKEARKLLIKELKNSKQTLDRKIPGGIDELYTNITRKTPGLLI